MAERSLFFNSIEIAPGVFDREYQAQDFTSYLKGLATTGILRDPVNADNLKVSVVSNSMDVNVAEGIAYVEGHYYDIINEPVTLTLSTPEPQYDRIDRIVLRLDLRLSERYVRAFVKEGISSTNPIAPDLERSELVYELSLAQIRVRKNTSSLQASDVTDERGDPVLCPWVSSKIIPNYNDDTLQAVLQEVQANDVKITDHINDFTGHVYYGIATGSGANISVNIPTVTKLFDGMGVSFKSTNITSAEGVRLNVSGKGLKPIVDSKGSPLKANAIRPGSINTVRYNATNGNFILQGEGGGLEPNIYFNLFASDSTIFFDDIDVNNTTGFVGEGDGKLRLVDLKTKESTSGHVMRDFLQVYAIRDGYIVNRASDYAVSSNNNSLLATKNGVIYSMGVDAPDNDTIFIADNYWTLFRMSNRLVVQAQSGAPITAFNMYVPDGLYIYALTYGNTLYKIRKSNLTIVAEVSVSAPDISPTRGQKGVLTTDDQYIYIDRYRKIEKRNISNLALVTSVEKTNVNNGIFHNGDYLFTGRGELLNPQTLGSLGTEVKLLGANDYGNYSRLQVGYENKVVATVSSGGGSFASEVFIDAD